MVEEEKKKEKKKANSILQSLSECGDCGLHVPDADSDLNRAEGILRGEPITPHADTVDMERMIELAKKRLKDNESKTSCSVGE